MFTHSGRCGAGWMTGSTALGAAIFFAGWPAPTARANPPIQIDVATVVSCSAVGKTDSNGSASGQEPRSSSDEADCDGQIVEARLVVSALVPPGADDIDELMVTVQSPGRRLWVTDFAPRTQTASLVADQKSVVERQEATAALIADGGAPVPPIQGHGAGGGRATLSRSHSLQTSYDAKQPRELSVASGTIDAGWGAFFKLVRLPQTTLQGACELVCRYAVPRGWRGDYLLVTVRATRRGDWPTRGTLVRAEETRLVALHRAGDSSARAAAQSLARAQAEFLTDPRSHESDPRRRLLVLADPRERELAAREPRRARPKNLYDAFRQKALGISATEPRAPSEQSLELALVALERLALESEG